MAPEEPEGTVSIAALPTLNDLFVQEAGNKDGGARGAAAKTRGCQPLILVRMEVSLRHGYTQSCERDTL